MISAIISFLESAVTSPPSPSGPSPIIYLLVAALGGGAIPVLVEAYRRHRRGPIEDEEMVGRIVSGQLDDMRKIMEQYKIEVEVTKRQLDDYRKQLYSITRELAAAQLRIHDLEEELRSTKERRTEITRELDRLVVERDRLESDRERLAREAEELRERVKRLEDFAERVHPGRSPRDNPD